MKNVVCSAYACFSLLVLSATGRCQSGAKGSNGSGGRWLAMLVGATCPAHGPAPASQRLPVPRKNRAAENRAPEKSRFQKNRAPEARNQQENRILSAIDPNHPEAPHVHHNDQWVWPRLLTRLIPHYHVDRPVGNMAALRVVLAVAMWFRLGGGGSRIAFLVRRFFAFSIAPYDYDYVGDWNWEGESHRHLRRSRSRRLVLGLQLQTRHLCPT